MDMQLDEALLRSWHHRSPTAEEVKKRGASVREDSPSQRIKQSRQHVEKWKVKMRENELAAEREEERRRKRDSRLGVRGIDDGTSLVLANGKPGSAYREKARGRRPRAAPAGGGFAERAVAEVPAG